MGNPLIWILGCFLFLHKTVEWNNTLTRVWRYFTYSNKPHTEWRLFVRTSSGKKKKKKRWWVKVKGGASKADWKVSFETSINWRRWHWLNLRFCLRVCRFWYDEEKTEPLRSFSSFRGIQPLLLQEGELVLVYFLHQAVSWSLLVYFL